MRFVRRNRWKKESDKLRSCNYCPKIQSMEKHFVPAIEESPNASAS